MIKSGFNTKKENNDIWMIYDIPTFLSKSLPLKQITENDICF